VRDKGLLVRFVGNSSPIRPSLMMFVPVLQLMHNIVLPLVALFVGGMYYQVGLTIGGER